MFNESVARSLNYWPNFVSTFPEVAYAYLRDYRKYRKDIFHSADTLVELARSVSIEPKHLQDSVVYSVQNKINSIKHKSGSDSKNRFYALGPISPVIRVTQGSLTINQNLQVISDKGKPIKALYAVGVSSAGPLYVFHVMHLGWSFTSGRLVGEKLKMKN